MDTLTLKINQLKTITSSALETLNDFKAAYDQSRLIKEANQMREKGKKLQVTSDKLYPLSSGLFEESSGKREIVIAKSSHEIKSRSTDKNKYQYRK